MAGIRVGRGPGRGGVAAAGLRRHSEVDQPAIVRVLTEHVDLRRRRQDLDASVDPDPAELREHGERLVSHIRFEERVLSR